MTMHEPQDLPATKAPQADAEATGISDLGRIQARFDALVSTLVTDAGGAPRSEAEVRACTDGVRAALDCLASGEEVAANAAGEGSLAQGTILANAFVVRMLIGIGGMAEVYQVRHRDLRCDYAIKILKPSRALDPLIVDLFAAEARALMALRNDGIVRAYALLRHGDGRPFLVLDLARGPTLAETLAAGALTPDELRAVGFRLSTSLAALHLAGLVHGDLSAENVVLVGGLEGAVLLDLGLAHSRESGSISFAGKWSIAAPELLEGAKHAPPSDMYALGLILAAAATGQRLDMGHDLESALARRRVVPSLGNMPRPLATLIGRLLDPTPSKRPTAAEMAQRFGASEPDWVETFRDALADMRAAKAMRRWRQMVPGSKRA